MLLLCLLALFFLCICALSLKHETMRGDSCFHTWDEQIKKKQTVIPTSIYACVKNTYSRCERFMFRIINSLIRQYKHNCIITWMVVSLTQKTFPLLKRQNAKSISLQTVLKLQQSDMLLSSFDHMYVWGEAGASDIQWMKAQISLLSYPQLNTDKATALV